MMKRITSGLVRIIAGKWRGRKVAFQPTATRRATPDRVRETLFNWLSPVIAHSVCLDLFAGSGVLGLEALSRGARKVFFVEQEKWAASCIEEHLKKFGAAEEGMVFCEEASRWLKQTSEKFDIVFLDPPFQSLLSNDSKIIRCFELLNVTAHLNPEAWIYVELPKRLKTTPIPANWSIYREKVLGEVRAVLCQYT